MQISVRTNVKEVRRTLKRIHKRQVPFATSQALNDTAFLIRQDTVTQLWPRSVNVKQRNFARAAFRVQKSHKRKLEAAVFDRLDRAFLPRQITGGIKLPYSGSHIAVPTANALTAGGRIKRNARLNDPALFKATIRGTLGLWKRDRKTGVMLMYRLITRASVPRAFPFYEFGHRTASIHFSRFMDRRLARAIATAR